MNVKLMVSLLLAVSLLAGCAGGNAYTLGGVAVGTGVGALSGAAIDRYNPWRGAALGGLLGGTLGGVAGAAYQQSRAPYQGQPQGYGPAYGQAYPTQDPQRQYTQDGQAPPARSGYREGSGAQGPDYQHAY